MAPALPTPRGPLSALLRDALTGAPRPCPAAEAAAGEELSDEDLQISLHLCYGLHYDGFVGVDDAWEWNASLLAIRAQIEEQFLRSLVGNDLSASRSVSYRDLSAAMEELLAAGGGRSLSSYALERGSFGQLQEFVIHRSVYQRKEADPHTWVIPRLRGRAKTACVQLQYDEYGSGVPGRSHAELFAETMEAFGLDPSPGAYVDVVPAETLATDNLVSLLGLHRRWRGALVGHLAAFEMTSVTPMARYAQAIRRHLPDTVAADFYDCHVVADAIHERIAAEDLLQGLVETDPEAARDVCIGASALMAVERRFADHLLDCWDAGQTSLRLPGRLPDGGKGLERGHSSSRSHSATGSRHGGRGARVVA